MARRIKNVTVPFDIAEFRAGDCVDYMQFMTRLSVVFAEKDRMIEDLEAELQEKEDKIYDLERENDGLHYEIENYYKPVNPYTACGVSPKDFR